MAKKKKETYLEDTIKIYPKMSDSEIRKFRIKEDFYYVLGITVYSMKFMIVIFIGFILFALACEFIINPIVKNINEQIEEIPTVVSEVSAVSTPLFENLSKQIIALPIEKLEESNVSNISNDINKSTEKTKFCPYCGTEIKSTYNYCTECGEKQN